MTTRNCGSCRHFYPDAADLRKGQCRECSPTPIAIGMSKGGPIILGYHAPVSREHVCGKWQLKIELPNMKAAAPVANLRQVNGGEG